MSAEAAPARRDLIARFGPVADGIAALLFPNAEVVIHDLASQTVVHIANNLSKREIGDDSALEDLGFYPAEQVIGPYEKLNWDGGRMRSVSIVARDAAGAAIGVVCVNLNLAAFDQAKAALALFLESPRVSPQPEALFRDDWQERLNTFLHAWLRERGRTLATLDRRDKRALVEALHAQGAFKGRSAPNYVAKVLGISRASVFNYIRLQRTAA